MFLAQGLAVVLILGPLVGSQQMLTCMLDRLSHVIKPSYYHHQHMCVQVKSCLPESGAVAPRSLCAKHTAEAECPS